MLNVAWKIDVSPGNAVRVRRSSTNGRGVPVDFTEVALMLAGSTQNLKY